MKRVQSIHTVSKNKTENFVKFFARQKLQQYYKDNARPNAELYKNKRRRFNGVFSHTIMLLSRYKQPEDKRMSSRYQLTKKANTTRQGTLNVWHEAANQKLNHVVPFFSHNKLGETATRCVCVCSTDLSGKVGSFVPIRTTKTRQTANAEFTLDTPYAPSSPLHGRLPCNWRRPIWNAAQEWCPDEKLELKPFDKQRFGITKLRPSWRLKPLLPVFWSIISSRRKRCSVLRKRRSSS